MADRVGVTGRRQTRAVEALFYSLVCAVGWSMVIPTPLLAMAVNGRDLPPTDPTSLVESPSEANSSIIEGPLDPEAFDLRTTTDTEVRRVRSILTMDLIDASLDHALAEVNLDQHEIGYEARLDQREHARDTLIDLERLIVETAVSQFKAENVVRPTAVLVPSIDAVAEEALTNFVIDQLTTDRAQTSDRLEDAQLAVQEAERSLRQARTRHLRSSQAHRAEQRRFKAFDQRAAEHQRVASAADQGAAARSETVELRSVAGTLTVNSTIEADIDRLITDARLAGLDLGGGGYRSEEEQAALRLANCDQSHEPGDPHAAPETPTGESPHRQYVIFEAPASSCSPPTAPPGKSQHQAGLAIDLTNAGQLLTETSPAYQWMTENGHDYSLANLPGEPWHWSTSGK